MLKYSPSRDIMIFAGDFNREKLKISYKGIPFQEKISAPTCCTNVSTLQGKHKEVYDHVLVHGRGKLESTETKTPGDKHSDHLPVVSTISFD
jgi:endonuclease/exonuclease/phosphatase family metal-dependent hydrolase